MGSFFRGHQYNDVDFVAVVESDNESLLNVGERIRRSLAEIEQELGAPVDVLILTTSEFQQQPLRDMSTLVPVYFR